MARVEIRIPDWVDRVCAWPVMVYRKQKYGYTFRRIDLGEGEWTILDEEDYYRYGNLKWTLGGNKKNFYAVSGIKDKDGNFKIVRMQRLIMNEPAGLLIDHKNRRANLRTATHSQNGCNKEKKKNTSSRFIGVCFDKEKRRWCAYIRHNGKKIFLGYFDNEIDAALAYDAAARKYHCEFARLNFPQENHNPEIRNTKYERRPTVCNQPKLVMRRRIRYTMALVLVTLLLKQKDVLMEQRKPELISSQRAGHRDVEPFRGKGTLSIGIDIGSTSSDLVILDNRNHIVLSDYRRTKGKPIETFREQLRDTFGKINPADVHTIAATGSAARLPAKLLEIPFINEVAAQAAAVSHLYPDIDKATVIEMGGQDSKLIFLQREPPLMSCLPPRLASRDAEAGDSKTRGRVKDFALNTVCAAGTGSFLDQQADRLGINIENEFGRLALESKNVPRMAGRCSVFAKSDMIHLQQQATPMCDILAGLCLALARNLKSNLGCGREFVKPIIFTGGVAANAGVVKAISDVFETKDGDLLVPDAHFFTGAIGAILVAKSKSLHCPGTTGLVEKIDDYIRQQGSAVQNAPRREPLAKPLLPPPDNYVYSELLAAATEPIEAYIGVDVGSLSTKAVVMDKQKRILAKIYLMTAGRPLDAIHQLMQEIGSQVKNKVKIIGAASTGSGRYLTGDFIGADVVINEITAQATGAAIVNPKVDTIFEIGGQDSKYISLNNGVVVDFEMNHACAAGTGSFLEEQAQRLGISIKDEFARLAFASKSPVKLGERCTVFMESDLLSYQQQGASTEDLVAGLAYSIVANYLNRVVGRRKIGDNICFQGGTAFNKAVWAAFENVTGKPIMLPDHYEVTGALGAAAIAAEHIDTIARQAGQRPQSKFKGFENLIKAEYTVESFTCEHCSNHCEIKKVQLAGSEPLYYGSRCDRYNVKKKTQKTSRFGAFEYRQDKLLEFAELNRKSAIGNRQSQTIGIPMALATWQMLPMFARFFKELGFEVVLSGRTSKETIRKGVESVTAQPCFPIKVANGHIVELIEKGVDYIFLPSIVSTTSNFPANEHNHFCPYVQSFPYQVRSAFADKLGNTKLLICPLRLGEGEKLAKKTFSELGKQLNIAVSKTQAAMEKALEAQSGFDQSLKDKGREILAKVKADEKLFVLVSRPYNGCDEGVSLQLPKKFADVGVEIMPVDMLDFDEAELSDETLHSAIYWSYGQKILRAAELIKRDNRLFGVYLSNFSCGPDSFLMPFFKDIMGEKPCLQLEIDEHSADAGVITRIEAFLESLKNYKTRKTVAVAPLVSSNVKRWKQPIRAAQPKIERRTLFIPYMSDASYGLAACLRGYGQSAEVMPMADERALMAGRAYTTGKECLPCAITSGEMLKVLSREGTDPRNVAFFMPSASGPCRFGLYHCMHDLVLKYAGYEEALVIAPNQDSNFYRDFVNNFDGVTLGVFMKDAWASLVGIDLLQKLILRMRPFAAEPKQAQEVYEKCLSRWVEAVEGKAEGRRQKLEDRRRKMDMVGLFEEFADEFATVKLDTRIQKPRIGIVGEIYVRNHTFANLNIISRLEELGAACDLAPLAEWIYYTNFTRGKMAWRRGQWKNLFTNTIQDFFQHRIERALAAPLEKKFGRLAEQPVEHVIGLAKPYIDASFEGEAILSIGKMVEYHKDGFGGVVNVMPFTCMPSTIVSTQTRQLSADCNEMPILNLSFDGQEDVTLTTRLEAFVEQVGARGKVGVGELVTT